MDFPTQKEIVLILRKHPLIKLKGRVKSAFVVGSFAKGNTHAESDIDILLEVEPVSGFNEWELTNYYRRLVYQYFMKHDIHGKCDSVHPQWENRRVDMYLTYDMSRHDEVKIKLQ